MYIVYLWGIMIFCSSPRVILTLLPSANCTCTCSILLCHTVNIIPWYTDSLIQWSPLLNMLRERILTMTGLTFNSMLANLYRNEKDSVVCITKVVTVVYWCFCVYLAILYCLRSSKQQFGNLFTKNFFKH